MRIINYALKVELELKLRAELKQECCRMVTREDGVIHFLQECIAHPTGVVCLNPREMTWLLKMFQYLHFACV